MDAIRWHNDRGNRACIEVHVQRIRQTWPRNIKGEPQRLPNDNWSIKFTIVKNVIYSFLAPSAFPIVCGTKRTRGREDDIFVNSFVTSPAADRRSAVTQLSWKQTAWHANTTIAPENTKLFVCLFVFAISKILLKLYGNFFNINRITNCISVLKERQWHIGVWSLYRFIVLYHAILKSPQSLQRLRDIFMYTSTAEGKFLTYQIGSFQIISRQSYYFIHNNHRHSSVLCGNPLEFLPRENIFFFNYYIATVVGKQRFRWVAKWTRARSTHAGNQ